MVLNVLAGQWRTVNALVSGSVILEMKNGVYEPLGRWASWIFGFTVVVARSSCFSIGRITLSGSTT